MSFDIQNKLTSPVRVAGILIRVLDGDWIFVVTVFYDTGTRTGWNVECINWIACISCCDTRLVKKWC